MTLTWTPVTDRVFVTTVEPHRVNVGLIVGDNAAALVDSGNSPEQGAELLAAATDRAGVPVTHVVVTHGHHDHVQGLPGMGGVESVAHENLTEATPSRTFSMAWSLDLGNQRIEVINFGSAHTDADAVVFVPGEDVVFAGDLLEEGADPQISDSGSLANWPTFLDGVLGATNNKTRFVPGHGAVVDRDFAFIQRAEIAMIYSMTESLIQQGVSVDDAATAVEWPFTAETLSSVLPKAYAELAAKGIVPKKQLPIFGL